MMFFDPYLYRHAVDVLPSSSNNSLETQRPGFTITQAPLLNLGGESTVDDKQEAAFVLGAMDKILSPNGFYH